MYAIKVVCMHGQRGTMQIMSRFNRKCLIMIKGSGPGRWAEEGSAPVSHGYPFNWPPVSATSPSNQHFLSLSERKCFFFVFHIYIYTFFSFVTVNMNFDLIRWVHFSLYLALPTKLACSRKLTNIRVMVSNLSSFFVLFKDR
jgi:hypothetical protein